MKPIKPTTMFAHQINGRFEHVFGSEIQVKMCGAEPIVQVEVCEDENGDYWGWDDFTGRVSMIWGTFMALEMCFTYGIEVAEKKGDGRRVKLKITAR